MDNAVELKMFLNEELQRLKAQLSSAAAQEVITADSEMQQKANQIMEELQTFTSKQIDEKMLTTILKTQNLVKELTANGDNN